ncbi:MAG: cytidine deaminase [Anaerolineales bacterium]|jgi:cytidine deaminase|nr:MAG: cytidine deaminase [Anaerolineales bacterium]
MNRDELVASATGARERSYAPYSNFKVGAALLGKSGRIYIGCNVENAAYGPSMCAERTAIFKAVSEGERDFEAIAAVSEGGASPCGTCRQVMMEFAPDMTVIIADTQGHTRLTIVRDLLPDGFTSDQLPRSAG